MDFLFDYVFISNNWFDFMFRVILLFFNLILISVIVLVFLYLSYRRNNLSIYKIIHLKRIWISLLIAVLLFTVIQPYISVILWGTVFMIIRFTDKKDTILLYTVEWSEYGVTNYMNDVPALWQNQKQIERWEIDHALYTLCQSHKIPKGLSFKEILQYYRRLKVIEPVKIMNQDKWRQSKLSWTTYFVGTYYLSLVNSKYAIELLDTLSLQNWIFGMVNIFTVTSGFVFLIYQIGSLLLTSESNGTRNKFRYNVEFVFFFLMFLICWIAIFYQTIVK